MRDRYYAISLKDTEKLKKSSSGGLAYAISEYCIKQGYLVYGVRYSEDYSGAHYVKLDHMEELVVLNGSKYITTEKRLHDGKTVFQSIYEALAANRGVLFIGTPCDVGALHQYLSAQGCQNCEKLLTLDFICQGPLKAEIQKDYIAFLEKKYKSKIVDFSVRYKNPLWTPVNLKAVFENGKEHIKPLYETDFGRAFMIFGLERCYQCAYKGTEHCSDITIGDFWGLGEEDAAYNKFGTSVAVVHSEKGSEVIHALESIHISQCDEEKAVGKNPMYSESRKRHPQFDQFQNHYQKRGLHKTIFLTRTPLSKMKYLVFLALGKRPY